MLYAPALRVTRRALLRKRRRLPLAGEVLVDRGERVARDRVVARAAVPGPVTSVNLVNRLSCSPGDLSSLMKRGQGEAVERGDILAETRPFIRWFRTSVASPVTGTIESVSTVTGQVLLREPPRPVELRAFLDGVVVDVVPGEGVDLEAEGAYIQAIFGVGGETGGPCRVLVDAPGDPLEPDAVPGDAKGAVLVGGSLLTAGAIAKAREAGAAALVAGGMHDRELAALLRRDLGVAVTGTEEIGLTILLTEGFGAIAMARRTFDILAERDGRDCSVSGATQIRAGVQRPEIFFAEEGAGGSLPSPQEAGLVVGASVRAVRHPHFGRLGRVVSLPEAPSEVPSGARLRVAEVAFEDGEGALLPRANLEIIQE